ncbi:AraC family transcriptional regulator (plasmid) [Streptomyces sp. NBC_00841]|uniref:AraC family transcriptional regulator n=1 Tax=Streptomyces sp. NBC_00841 TaxID=2975847 RepID=UPI002DD8C182|nr:AraC family transcriptional regulator [Streptomyces sp. NBC_00841]WSA05721.1 AraC family transcriptional regulator [Streptomyces sp. NBC_00841]
MTAITSDRIDLAVTPERVVLDLAGRGLAPLMALGRYRYLHANEPLPPFRHASLVVLAAPRRGPVAFEVDGRPRAVSPGQVICLPPGCTYSTGRDIQPRGELFWLILKAVGKRPKDALSKAIALFAAGPSDVWEMPAAVVADLDRALGIDQEHDDWITDGQLQHMVSAAVLGLARARAQRHTPAQPAPQDGLAPILEWIEAHLTEPLDAAGLSAAAGLSPSRFYEVFRQATGTTPKDYVLRRKLERALEQLATDPQATVTEVAHALGFSSSQYFATVFRKYHGTSPSRIRPAAQPPAR